VQFFVLYVFLGVALFFVCSGVFLLCVSGWCVFNKIYYIACSNTVLYY